MNRTRPTTNDQRPTITSWLQENTKTLTNAGIASAQLDCKILLETVLQKDRAWIAAHSDEILSKADLKKLSAFITQRKSRMPLAYIVGSKEFYGRNFLVNEAVLIPRPESEAIIDIVKDIANQQDINTVMDIGTGSGCLAITIKNELPDVHVTGIDISPPALQIAKKNAGLHGTQIQWKRIDVQLQGIPKMPKTRPYILVANLPYVPDGFITSEEITKEPRVALFSGIDGLDHYRSLFQSLQTQPNKPFAVITESLTSQHKVLEMIAKKDGYRLQKTTNLVQLFTSSKI